MKERKEAAYWKSLGKGIVRCELCPHFCVLGEGGKGKCNVRKNLGGKLISLSYGKICSISIDPIEKKPLYHFLPGEKTLSIATPGCNFKCGNCQNWEISQADNTINTLELKPEQIIKKAKENNIKIISYTYTEPTIFYEYMLETAKLAKKAKIKNVIVSNGFINQKPLLELIPYIDGANIDLKSIENDFYERVCHGKLLPVLETLKTLKGKGIWLEITNLLIPELNDSDENIKKLIDWIKKNLGNEVPVHFTGFFPTYKLSNLPPTSIETLRKARNIALNKGLKYIYTGNITDSEGENTICQNCSEILIKRRFFQVLENKIKKRKCSKCGENVPGVWQ